MCIRWLQTFILVERLKKELETERKEAQRLRSLLRIAEDTTRMERQEKERLLTEVARLQQSQYRQEAGGRKVCLWQESRNDS